MEIEDLLAIEYSREKRLPILTVAVVVKNEIKYIKKCLDALVGQNYPSDCYDILVVDGNSTDGTLQIVEEFASAFNHIRLIENSDGSYWKGLNISLKEARGDIWVFVDGHAIVANDFLRMNVEYLDKIDAACVGGVITTVGEGYIGKSIAYALSTPFGAGDARFRYSSKAGFVETVPFGAYRKSVLDQVGFFDEKNYPRSADLDFNSRIRRIGGTFFLTPDIKSLYFARSTLRGMAKQAFGNGSSVMKTLHATSVRHLVPLIFVVCLLMSIIFSFFLPFSRSVFWLIVGPYAFLTLLFSLIPAYKYGWQYFPLLIIIYPLLHLSYGIGSAFSLISNLWGVVSFSVDQGKAG